MTPLASIFIMWIIIYDIAVLVSANIQGILYVHSPKQRQKQQQIWGWRIGLMGNTFAVVGN